MRVGLFALMLFYTLTSWSADMGTALKNDTLRQEPYTDAKATAPLKRGETLEILEKRGAWLKVKNGQDKQGWVKLLSVKRIATPTPKTSNTSTTSKTNTSTSSASSSAPSSPSTPTSNSVLSLNSGRSGTGQIVSTTGVRGLSEESLKAAKFDVDQMNKLESLAANKQDAQQFAQSGGLQARQVDYLPEGKGK